MWREREKQESCEKVPRSKNWLETPSSYVDMWSETIDYKAPISFSNEDEVAEDSSEDYLVEFSKATKKLLSDSCTSGVSNEDKKWAWSNFKLPKVLATQ